MKAAFYSGRKPGQIALTLKASGMRYHFRYLHVSWMVQMVEASDLSASPVPVVHHSRFRRRQGNSQIVVQEDKPPVYKPWVLPLFSLSRDAGRQLLLSRRLSLSRGRLGRW